MIHQTYNCSPLSSQSSISFPSSFSFWSAFDVAVFCANMCICSFTLDNEEGIIFTVNMVHIIVFIIQCCVMMISWKRIIANNQMFATSPNWQWCVIQSSSHLMSSSSSSLLFILCDIGQINDIYQPKCSILLVACCLRFSQSRSRRCFCFWYFPSQ